MLLDLLQRVCSQLSVLVKIVWRSQLLRQRELFFLDLFEVLSALLSDPLRHLRVDSEESSGRDRSVLLLSRVFDVVNVLI